MRSIFQDLSFVSLLIFKRRIIYHVIVSALVPLLILGAPRPSLAQNQLLSEGSGVVSRVDGEVWYRSPDVAEPQRLRAGVKLSAGDTVVTGTQGRVEWSLNSGSYLLVSAASQVTVHKTGPGQMHFDIERGEVFAVVDSLDPQARLKLDTPLALLNVTQPGLYRIRVGEDAATEAAVGRGELQFKDGAGKKVRVMKGESVRLTVQQPGRDLSRRPD